MKKNLNEFWELESDWTVTAYVQQQILTSAADKASSVLITYLVIPSNYGTNTAETASDTPYSRHWWSQNLYEK